MTTFDSREKAFENKFFQDKEMEFKVVSRRRKLLGLWAAEQMRLNDEAALAYALEVVRHGIEDSREGAVVNKILADLQKAGLDIDEHSIRRKMDKLHKDAEAQIKKEVTGKAGV